MKVVFFLPRRLPNRKTPTTTTTADHGTDRGGGRLGRLGLLVHIALQLLELGLDVRRGDLPVDLGGRGHALSFASGLGLALRRLADRLHRQQDQHRGDDERDERTAPSSGCRSRWRPIGPVGICRPRSAPSDEEQDTERQEDRARRAEGHEAAEVLERIDRLLLAVVLDQLPELASTSLVPLSDCSVPCCLSAAGLRGHGSSLTSRHFLPGTPGLSNVVHDPRSLADLSSDRSAECQPLLQEVGLLGQQPADELEPGSDRVGRAG